jgi:hypothetical protein
MGDSELTELLFNARVEKRTWAEISVDLNMSVSTLRRLRIRTGFVDPNPPQNVLNRELNESQHGKEYPSDSVVKETLTDMLILGFSKADIAKELGNCSLIFFCSSIAVMS